ncbi:MAG: hypothetical protein IIZ00_08345, partial [Oscillospiraceae bacterium]|nr:hypothetical protein [Oscillospiraceae bacterium]
MRKRSLLALMILLCLLLTGCYAFDSESFYALPKRSEQFSELQAAAEAAMNGGEYSAPVSGSNRQAVQQADLDGDGTDEALVFCKTGVSMPLKVLILKRNDSSYRLLTTVESDGTAFDSVQYAEMDGAPGLELILSRRIGEQVQQYLGVYTLDNGSAVELLSVRCSLYTTLDMDRDQRTDLFVLQSNSEGPTAYANLYRWRDGSLQKDAEASLSMASESVKRVLTGNLSMNVPAVFIASAYDESNLITDVFALRQGVFTNVTQNAESGQSSQTVRNYYVYSTDIDNDGVIEMPDTVALAELFKLMLMPIILSAFPMLEKGPKKGLQLLPDWRLLRREPDSGTEEDIDIAEPLTAPPPAELQEMVELNDEGDVPEELAETYEQESMDEVGEIPGEELAEDLSEEELEDIEPEEL